MTHRRTLLLSLRPRFAEAILSGVKTVELRRRPISAQPNTPIILYASSPTKAIVGTVRLRDVHALAPNDAWHAHQHSLGLTRCEFDAYLDGSPCAYLLLLHRICTLDRPLPLNDLRRDGPFQPPQSFRYVADSDPVALHGLVSVARKPTVNQAKTEHPNITRKPAARHST